VNDNLNKSEIKNTLYTSPKFEDEEDIEFINLLPDYSETACQEINSK
jgi:hypothetical protein